MKRNLSLAVIYAIFGLFLFFSPSYLLGTELSLKTFLELALKNNLELKAFQRELKSAQLEKEAIRGDYFPRLKFEENFLKSDIPAQVFTFKLNQGDISAKDMELKNLTNPKSRTNFETKITLELPIWLGGKIQAQEKAASFHLQAVQNLYSRKEEEVLSQVYEAYLWAILTKESIKVSMSSLEEAKEYLRLAKARYEVGTALLSDVYRAEVYLAQAKESLERAKNQYVIAKKNLELLVNSNLGEFDVIVLDLPPQIDINKIKAEALLKRADLKALEEEIKAKKLSSRAILAENLPQITAFASVSMNDKDVPFGSSGSGYLVGIGLNWAFDIGLTTYKKAQAEKEKALSLEERYRYLKDRIFYEIDKGYAEYQTALYKLKSAEERIKYAEEMVRILSLRYQNGLAKIIDLLDAQMQLDLARFERIQALRDLHQAYLEILLAGGRLKELL
ncbi:MAG: TolC family protein [Caldimicrobium sp.]